MPPKQQETRAGGGSKLPGKTQEGQNADLAQKVVQGIVDLVDKGVMYRTLARSAIFFALDNLLKVDEEAGKETASKEVLQGCKLCRLMLLGACKNGIISEDEAHADDIAHFAQLALPEAFKPAYRGGQLDEVTILVGVLGLAMQGVLKEGNVPETLADYFKNMDFATDKLDAGGEHSTPQEPPGYQHEVQLGLSRSKKNSPAKGGKIQTTTGRTKAGRSWPGEGQPNKIGPPLRQESSKSSPTPPAFNRTCIARLKQELFGMSPKEENLEEQVCSRTAVSESKSTSPECDVFNPLSPTALPASALAESTSPPCANSTSSILEHVRFAKVMNELKKSPPSHACNTRISGREIKTRSPSTPCTHQASSAGEEEALPTKHQEEEALAAEQARFKKVLNELKRWSFSLTCIHRTSMTSEADLSMREETQYARLMKELENLSPSMPCIYRPKASVSTEEGNRKSKDAIEGDVQEHKVKREKQKADYDKRRELIAKLMKDIRHPCALRAHRHAGELSQMEKCGDQTAENPSLVVRVSEHSDHEVKSLHSGEEVSPQSRQIPASGRQLPYSQSRNVAVRSYSDYSPPISNLTEQIPHGSRHRQRSDQRQMSAGKTQTKTAPSQRHAASMVQMPTQHATLGTNQTEIASPKLEKEEVPVQSVKAKICSKTLTKMKQSRQGADETQTPRERTRPMSEQEIKQTLSLLRCCSEALKQKGENKQWVDRRQTELSRAPIRGSESENTSTNKQQNETVSLCTEEYERTSPSMQDSEQTSTYIGNTSILSSAGISDEPEFPAWDNTEKITPKSEAGSHTSVSTLQLASKITSPGSIFDGKTSVCTKTSGKTTLYSLSDSLIPQSLSSQITSVYTQQTSEIDESFLRSVLRRQSSSPICQHDTPRIKMYKNTSPLSQNNHQASKPEQQNEQMQALSKSSDPVSGQKICIKDKTEFSQHTDSASLNSDLGETALEALSATATSRCAPYSDKQTLNKIQSPVHKQNGQPTQCDGYASTKNVQINGWRSGTERVRQVPKRSTESELAEDDRDPLVPNSRKRLTGSSDKSKTIRSCGRSRDTYKSKRPRSKKNVSVCSSGTQTSSRGKRASVSSCETQTTERTKTNKQTAQRSQSERTSLSSHVKEGPTAKTRSESDEISHLLFTAPKSMHLESGPMLVFCPIEKASPISYSDKTSKNSPSDQMAACFDAKQRPSLHSGRSPSSASKQASPINSWSNGKSPEHVQYKGSSPMKALMLARPLLALGEPGSLRPHSPKRDLLQSHEKTSPHWCTDEQNVMQAHCCNQVSGEENASPNFHSGEQTLKQTQYSSLVSVCWHGKKISVCKQCSSQISVCSSGQQLRVHPQCNNQTSVHTEAWLLQNECIDEKDNTESMLQQGSSKSSLRAQTPMQAKKQESMHPNRHQMPVKLEFGEQMLVRSDQTLLHTRSSQMSPRLQCNLPSPNLVGQQTPSPLLTEQISVHLLQTEQALVCSNNEQTPSYPSYSNPVSVHSEGEQTSTYSQVSLVSMHSKAEQTSLCSQFTGLASLPSTMHREGDISIRSPCGDDVSLDSTGDQRTVHSKGDQTSVRSPYSILVTLHSKGQQTSMLSPSRSRQTSVQSGTETSQKSPNVSLRSHADEETSTYSHQQRSPSPSPLQSVISTPPWAFMRRPDLSKRHINAPGGDIPRSQKDGQTSSHSHQQRNPQLSPYTGMVSLPPPGAFACSPNLSEEHTNAAGGDLCERSVNPPGGDASGRSANAFSTRPSYTGIVSPPPPPPQSAFARLSDLPERHTNVRGSDLCERSVDSPGGDTPSRSASGPGANNSLPGQSMSSPKMPTPAACEKKEKKGMALIQRMPPRAHAWNRMIMQFEEQAREAIKRKLFSRERPDSSGK